MDPELAERMLNGEAVGPPRLVDLVGAATRGIPTGSGTGRDALGAAMPMIGEDDAVAAFRLARRRPEPRRPALARAAAIKVGALALALAAGGVAVAAGVGVISNPLPGQSPGPGEDPASRFVHPSYTVGPSDTGGPVQPSASVLADAAGQCRAYKADAAKDPAGARRRFSLLAAAAGGADKIDAFCAVELAKHPVADHGSSSPHPSATPHATGPGPHPSGRVPTPQPRHD